MLLRLLPKPGRTSAGAIRYCNRNGRVIDLLQLDSDELRDFRWKECAMVFQGAMNSFNPVLHVWDQMLDTVRAHKAVSRVEVRERSVKLLRMVQLQPDRILKAYPHELSGGMRQRVLIAMALLLDPQVMILDEPTTALDILTQRAIIDVLRSLRQELDFAMIFISHDLALAAELADRVATMYAGRVVEQGAVRDIFYRPPHSPLLIRRQRAYDGCVPGPLVIEIPGRFGCTTLRSCCLNSDGFLPPSMGENLCLQQLLESRTTPAVRVGEQGSQRAANESTIQGSE